MIAVKAYFTCGQLTSTTVFYFQQKKINSSDRRVKTNHISLDVNGEVYFKQNGVKILQNSIVCFEGNLLKKADL